MDVSTHEGGPKMGDKGGKKDRERNQKQKAKRKGDEAKAKQQKNHKEPAT